ncbi:hypothetical protein DFP73DRAFT_635917 [Morchella snyderi]|nr:hypothetical protein DFP73DRAFT_635917 [Morchella snyderi]
MTFAADILVQLTTTIVTLNRLTTAGAYPAMTTSQREDALLHLRVSAEVLHKLAEVARLETLAAAGSGPPPDTPA